MKFLSVEAVESANELKNSRIEQDFRGSWRRSGAPCLRSLGLAFKPNTDDMRDAPSRAIIDGLIRKGARVEAFDPAVMHEARRIYPDPGVLKLVTTPEEALEGAGALVIATEWTVFRSPNWSDLKQRLKRSLIFDGRNMFEPGRVRNHGFEYHCMGR